jgi:hypothetical protein
VLGRTAQRAYATTASSPPSPPYADPRRPGPITGCTARPCPSRRPAAPGSPASAADLRVGGEDRTRADTGPAGHGTPASAGKTSSARPRSASASEHPRVSGEDSSGTFVRRSRSGAPERRRVRPAHGRGDPHRHRSTPASAGRTPPRGPLPPPGPDHPRVGGEDLECLERECDDYGPPPRRRGGRAPAGHPRPAGRNTPRRREGTSAAVGMSSSCGTPPRRRGGPLLGVGEVVVQRNTPASAGRTPASSSPLQPWTGHPRVGGEDPASISMRIAVSGTPPRRRGGPGRNPLRDRRHRNTPASAGRTNSEPGQSGSSTEHPRASAGRTARRPGHRPWAPEHPRVGGEDTSFSSWSAGMTGKPPRRRGRPV